MGAVPGRSTRSLEVISTTVAIFRKEPPAALKSAILAAVLSWVFVAAFNAGDCLSESGSCILASPASWLYWAPVFLVLWLVFALWLRRRKDRNDF
jgi:hypothetical protein